MADGDRKDGRTIKRACAGITWCVLYLYLCINNNCKAKKEAPGASLFTHADKPIKTDRPCCLVSVPITPTCAEAKRGLIPWFDRIRTRSPPDPRVSLSSRASTSQAMARASLLGVQHSQAARHSTRQVLFFPFVFR